MTTVFRHSKAKGNDRVVLLVLADHADDEGRGAYPSHATIAAKANCSERCVRDCLDRLVESGELVRQGKHPRARTIVYDVQIDSDQPGKSCRPAASAARQPAQPSRQPVADISRQPVADKPSGNHPLEPERDARADDLGSDGEALGLLEKVAQRERLTFDPHLAAEAHKRTPSVDALAVAQQLHDWQPDAWPKNLNRLWERFLQQAERAQYRPSAGGPGPAWKPKRRRTEHEAAQAARESVERRQARMARQDRNAQPEGEAA